MVECQPSKLFVVGSIPSTRSKFAAVAQLVEQLISNHQVGGSIPSSSTTIYEGILEGKIRRLQALRRYREVQVPTDFGHATCGV